MRILLTIILLLSLFACKQADTIAKESDNSVVYHDLKAMADSSYLLRVGEETPYQLGIPCGYINQKGDTIIPPGKYDICWTDTIRTFGIVFDKDSGYIGIDKKDKRLYEVKLYDNGPDWVEDGLFRVLRNGKIGYADEAGYIKIKPQFECADQFEDGRARVALKCELVPDGEYTMQKSDEWFYIDKEGNRID